MVDGVFDRTTSAVGMVAPAFISLPLRADATTRDKAIDAYQTVAPDENRRSRLIAPFLGEQLRGDRAADIESDLP